MFNSDKRARVQVLLVLLIQDGLDAWLKSDFSYCFASNKLLRYLELDNKQYIYKLQANLNKYMTRIKVIV
jgi:hypothetical protein